MLLSKYYQAYVFQHVCLSTTRTNAIKKINLVLRIKRKTKAFWECLPLVWDKQTAKKFQIGVKLIGSMNKLVSFIA